MNSDKTSGQQPKKGVCQLIWLVIFITVLTGCQVPQRSQPEKNLQKPSISATPLSATETPTISPTNIPTPWEPLTEGDGIPADVLVLSAENIADLQVLGSWGDGIAYEMQWSPDGKFLAISTSRAILLIDPQSMTLLKRIPVRIPLYTFTFSSDGKSLLGGGAQGKFFHYDLASETLEELPLKWDSPIMALASGHTRPVLLAADWKATISLVDLIDEVQATHLMTTLQGSEALGFSADDKKIYTWSTIEPIKRWNLATLKMEQEIYFGLDANEKTGSQVRFSGDGKSAVVNQTWLVRVQSLEDGTTLGLFSGFNQPVLDIAISSDGAFVFALLKDKVQVWESRKSKVIAEIKLAEEINNPRFLQLSADDSRLVLLSNRLNFFTWNGDTSQIEEENSLPLALASAEAFCSLRLSGNELGFALVDGTTLRFDLATGGYSSTPSLSEIFPVAALVGKDGVSIQAFADRTMQINQEGDTQAPIKIRGLSQAAVQVLLAPESGLVSAQTGQQLSGLWNLPDGSFLKKQDWKIVVERLDFSPDEKVLIASGRGQTQVYDIAMDSLSGVVEGRYLTATAQGMLLERYAVDGPHLVMIGYDGTNMLYQLPGGAHQAVFSPDGSLLVVGGANLVIWNTANQQKLLDLPNADPSAKLVFSEDGRAILLAASDGSVIFLGVPPIE